ncbi:hypothetical protein ACIOJD_33635 [Streptomyces sp. NPDC088116]|uniref:hypothetical protein n=1 Tax=Streptomyces sp. NPDC088116 TaxID=3365825 RepID=UPI0037F878CF
MSWTRKRTVTGSDGHTYTEITHAEGEATEIAPGVKFIATSKNKKNKTKKNKKSDH